MKASLPARVLVHGKSGAGKHPPGYVEHPEDASTRSPLFCCPSLRNPFLSAFLPQTLQNTGQEGQWGAEGVPDAAQRAGTAGAVWQQCLVQPGRLRALSQVRSVLER